MVKVNKKEKYLGEELGLGVTCSTPVSLLAELSVLFPPEMVELSSLITFGQTKISSNRIFANLHVSIFTF